MSGTLLLEGGPPGEGCGHGFKYRYACPTCNPVIAAKGQEDSATTSKREDDNAGKPPARRGRPRKKS